MPDQQEGKYRHFILEDSAQTEPYQRPRTPVDRPPIPDPGRQAHGSALLDQVKALVPQMTAARQAQEEAGLDGGFGVQVEFESFPDIELAFESLARERQGIELLNARHGDQRTYATVFVPDGKLRHFEHLIQDYLGEKRDSAGRVRDHANLINTIREIRAAGLRALWTDDDEAFPTTDDEMIWWEVWLPVGEHRAGTVDTFCALAQRQAFEVAPGTVEFPERTVLLIRGSMGQMKQSMMVLNSIAELRRAKETAEFFDSLAPEGQGQRLDELLGRTEFAGADELAPHVCLLDTGVNNGHPWIAPALDDSDLHTIEPAWGTDDADGHGTEMAGLALAGDLFKPLSSGEPVGINHRLESVKLIRRDGGNVGGPEHHGYLTVEAVSRPEISKPHRQRVFSMPVTAEDNRDRGRPSAWSATVDSLAADADGQGASPRLILVSAGNAEPAAWADYPESNTTDSIHDPGQAWNALTVGAYTDLVEITEPNTEDCEPIAPPGGLSPSSTTSVTWPSQWPLKPDIVLEGGNVSNGPFGPETTHSLNLLTTYRAPNERLFTTTNGTSAATALAARMAAQLMAEYPTLWPESIRALMLHSAMWTDAMHEQFLPADRHPRKTGYVSLVRHCGFGVPDLQRALWSVSNSLTMVAEETLHPYQRQGSAAPKLRDMNLHRLPWPLEELEALGEAPVEMRVTLSYFIEPNPSVRGFRSRYCYESHGLRFDVKRPLEADADFRSRVNAAARDEEHGTRSRGDDEGWLIGPKSRHKGSIHSDIWCGTATDLASRGVLAVWPTAGWWKTRHGLERYDSLARYSLIVSIHAPEVEVDLYTAVANQIAVPVAVEI